MRTEKENRDITLMTRFDSVIKELVTLSKDVNRKDLHEMAYDLRCICDTETRHWTR